LSPPPSEAGRPRRMAAWRAVAFLIITSESGPIGERRCTIGMSHGHRAMRAPIAQAGSTRLSSVTSSSSPAEAGRPQHPQAWRSVTFLIITVGCGRFVVPVAQSPGRIASGKASSTSLASSPPATSSEPRHPWAPTVSTSLPGQVATTQQPAHAPAPGESHSLQSQWRRGFRGIIWAPLLTPHSTRTQHSVRPH
jgi:hypothetical protein